MRHALQFSFFYTLLAIYLIMVYTARVEEIKIIYVKGKWLSFLALLSRNVRLRRGLFFVFYGLHNFSSFENNSSHFFSARLKQKKVLEMNHHHCRFFCLNDSRGREGGREWERVSKIWINIFSLYKKAASAYT